LLLGFGYGAIGTAPERPFPFQSIVITIHGVTGIVAHLIA
jgi:hypothetical protein